jgi:hypothetical protein
MKLGEPWDWMPAAAARIEREGSAFLRPLPLPVQAAGQVVFAVLATLAVAAAVGLAIEAIRARTQPKVITDEPPAP